MNRLDGGFLLAIVCLLLVAVAGAVESGRISGANYQAALPILSLNFSWARPQYLINPIANPPLSNKSANPVSQPPQPSQNPFSTFASTAFPTLPEWLIVGLAVAFFAGACYLALRQRTTAKVVDLEETLKEMELEQKRLAQAWSYRLRNMALLRYYVLMRGACAKIGLQETLTETPKEYIERASAFLKVDGEYSGKFADAVNRCRYGEELSSEETSAASKFMGDFTDVIRGRTNAP